MHIAPSLRRPYWTGLKDGHGVDGVVPADACVAVVEGVVKTRLKRPEQLRGPIRHVVHGLELMRVVERHEHRLRDVFHAMFDDRLRHAEHRGQLGHLLANVAWRLPCPSVEEAATAGHRNGVTVQHGAGHLR